MEGRGKGLGTGSCKGKVAGLFEGYMSWSRSSYDTFMAPKRLAFEEVSCNVYIYFVRIAHLLSAV